MANACANLATTIPTVQQTKHVKLAHHMLPIAQYAKISMMAQTQAHISLHAYNVKMDINQLVMDYHVSLVVV